MSTSLASLEPKAKRTHARRSCELCKVRKTRCELPDIDVPSTSEPLPVDKACHRCRVLALPCVVDDVARKPSKRRAAGGGAGVHSSDVKLEDGSPAGAGGSKPKVPRTRTNKVGVSGHGDGRRDPGDGIDHSLEVMHGIHPELEWTGSNGEPALYSSDPFLRSSPASSTFGMTGPPKNVMQLHGRSLELLCAMLRVAYAKSEIKDGRQTLHYENIDWSVLVDGALRARLEIGFAQLRTFHPYLDPLPAIFDRCCISSGAEDQLLLCLIIYLCTLPLAPEPPIAKLRLFLRPRISFLRDRVLLQAPRSFTTIQALELLSTHAPLGVVPLQLTDPRSVSVARGHLALLQATSSYLNFHGLFSALMSRERDLAWSSPDCLLFLSMTATESFLALEDEVPRSPPALKEARYMASKYLDESRDVFWRNALESLSPSCLIGRLGLFDRLSRLGEVLDSLDRLRRTLESAVADSTFNPVDAIAEEFTLFAQRMDRCDARHDALLSIISPISQNLERGYITHRALRRRYEHIKVLALGLRYLVATSYIPCTRLALPTVPTDIPPHQRVAYAIGRASNPADIMPVLTQNSPATMVIWQYGTHRGEICQQILNGLAELENIVIPRSESSIGGGGGSGGGMEAGGEISVTAPPTASLLPLHECFAFAVDSAKMLMEMRAGTLLLHRRSGNLHEATLAPIWVNSLKKACHTLRLIGLLSPPPASSAGSGSGVIVSEKGLGEGETVANGCSNILGSMVRLTEEWGRSSLAREKAANGTGAGTGMNTEHVALAMKEAFDAGVYPSTDQDGPGGDRAIANQGRSGESGSGNHTSPDMLGPVSASRHTDSHPFGENATQQQDQYQHPQSYPMPYDPATTYMDSSDRWMAATSSRSSGAGGTGVHNPYLAERDGQAENNGHSSQQQQQQQAIFENGNGSYGAESHRQHTHAHPPASRGPYHAPPLNLQQHQQQQQQQQQAMMSHSNSGTGEVHGGGEGAANGASGGQGHDGGYPPTALDLLLSQMFHYGPPQQ